MSYSLALFRMACLSYTVAILLPAFRPYIYFSARKPIIWQTRFLKDAKHAASDMDAENVPKLMSVRFVAATLLAILLRNNWRTSLMFTRAA